MQSGIIISFFMIFIFFSLDIYLLKSKYALFISIFTYLYILYICIYVYIYINLFFIFKINSLLNFIASN